MDESYFARPFVEVDEWRDGPVRHRYVHGGFDGTETQFSLYFPPAEQYEGRFLHHIEGGGGGTPRAQPNDIALACSYGGYLVDLYLVAPYRGAFDAKCIVVQNLHDGQCWPCGAENLRRLLVERRGSARTCACGSPSTRCTCRGRHSGRGRLRSRAPG